MSDRGEEARDDVVDAQQEHDADHRHALRSTSDRLLEAVDDLRATEQLKRRAPMSSPEFHRLAEQVQQKSNEIWREAAMERREGDALSRQQAVSIEETPPEGDDER
jgi:hypothetical protein